MYSKVSTVRTARPDPGERRGRPCACPAPGERVLGVGTALGLRERGSSDFERVVRLHTGTYVHAMYQSPFRV